MDQSEEMAKLRAIVEGAAAEHKKEKLDEMFFFPPDKSPEGQRRTNQPRDNLGNRGPGVIAKDPKGYKRLMKGKGTLTGKDWATQDVTSRYKATGPKGVLPEDEMDEMFFYPDDRTDRQKARDAQGHDELARRQEMLGKDWLSKPNDYKTKDDPRYQGTYKIKGPKGVLPEEDTAGNELENLMREYGVIEEGGCNMTAEGMACPVHGLAECGGYMEEAKKNKNKKPDADDDGIPDWADKNPHKKGGDEDRKVKESIHIDIDGAEAAMFINRMAELAGSPAHVDSGMNADMCQGCGCEMDQCACDDVCVDCGCADCECDSTQIMPMENADHDYSRQVHDPEGEPVDVDKLTWRARTAPGTQGLVKSNMGDNPLLVKEDADQLFRKLKGDYKAYIAEAELARSNAGEMSPLTANNRDEFEKDPFAGEEPVTDGTHSPLSTVRRQHVAK